MAPTTGFLFLQFSSILNPSQLIKIITTVVRKVEKSFYIFVKDIPAGTSIVNLNKVVNQLYESSTNNAPSDSFDTRVLLTDMRQSIFNNLKPLDGLSTTIPVDIIFSLPTFTISSISPFAFKNEQPKTEVIELVFTEQESASHSTIESSTSINFHNLANPNRTYPHVVMGGTFDRLHVGHKILLSAAVLRSEKSLTIGVTDGEMIHTKKLWELIEPCETRIRKLREFLQDIEPRLDYRIVPIQDPYGPTAYDPNLQVE